MPYVTSIERMAREEGMEKGIEKGREEGMEKGREVMLFALETALELKFAAEGLAVMSEIRDIKDIDVLLTICKALNTANNVDELRRLWAK